MKWKKREVTIGITRIEDGVTKAQADAVRKALRASIAEINGVGAAIRLVEVGKKPDIRVRLVVKQIAPPRAVRNLNDYLLNNAGGRVRLGLSGQTIRAAEIDIATFLKPRQLQSVVLEEVTQSLGLVTDIHNRLYHNKSIFSETGSRTKRLRGQDAMVLRVHYPN
jgi:hypothetical protein